MKHPEFLPMTRQEMTACGYDELDILIHIAVAGDISIKSSLSANDNVSAKASIKSRVLVKRCG